MHWTDAVARAAREDGFDISCVFDVAAYDRAVEDRPVLRPLGRGLPATGLVVGNGRALWSSFEAHLARNPGYRLRPDPLDDFVEAIAPRALRGAPAGARVYFGHEAGSRRVSMVDAAKVSGFAHAGPLHLLVHPERGSWFGLRYVVVVDGEAPPPVIPAPDVCHGCPAPCVPAFARALEASDPRRRTDRRLGPTWPLWLAVRDACPVGVDARYGPRQVRYHYSRERRLLRGAD